MLTESFYRVSWSGLLAQSHLTILKASQLNQLKTLHKLSLSLKELRETDTCLKLLRSSEILIEDQVKDLINESNELQAILFSSIRTLKTKNDELEWRTKS